MEAWKIQHGHSDANADLMCLVKERDIKMRAITQGQMEIPVGGRITHASFSYQAATLWNMLPSNVREQQKQLSAKNKIREFVSSFP